MLGLNRSCRGQFEDTSPPWPLPLEHELRVDELPKRWVKRSVGDGDRALGPLTQSSCKFGAVSAAMTQGPEQGCLCGEGGRGVHETETVPGSSGSEDL